MMNTPRPTTRKVIALAPRQRKRDLDGLRAARAALLEAAGFELVPLRHPLAAVWQLLAVAPTTLMLVSVIRGDMWPEVGMGFAYSLPPGWPVWTRRRSTAGRMMPPSLRG